jgi:hypothetical protein
MKLEMLFVSDVRPLLDHSESNLRGLGFRIGFYGGSRATCSPPPKGTDNDIFLHVRDVGTACTVLLRCGWDFPLGPSDYNGEYKDFATMRRGEDNVLLFSDEYEFGAVWGATCLAKTMNIQDKAERYALFEAARAPWRD